MAEANLGVVAACLPTLRPLYDVYSLNKVVDGLRRLKTAHKGTHSAEGNSSTEPRLDEGNRPRLYHRGVYEEYRTDHSSTDGIYMEPVKYSNDIMAKKNISEHYEEV